MSGRSRQLYELNILDRAHTEPLWSVRMSTGAQIGGSGHTSCSSASFWGLSHLLRVSLSESNKPPLMVKLYHFDKENFLSVFAFLPHALSYALLVSSCVLSPLFSYLWFFSACCFQLLVCVKIVFLIPPVMFFHFHFLTFIQLFSFSALDPFAFLSFTRTPPLLPTMSSRSLPFCPASPADMKTFQSNWCCLFWRASSLISVGSVCHCLRRCVSLSLSLLCVNIGEWETARPLCSYGIFTKLCTHESGRHESLLASRRRLSLFINLGWVLIQYRLSWHPSGRELPAPALCCLATLSSLAAAFHGFSCILSCQLCHDQCQHCRG